MDEMFIHKGVGVYLFGVAWRR